MKAFRPLEGRRCDEIQFEWIHLVNYYSRKPSFTLKILQNPFLRTPDGYDGRSFRRRGGEKKHFFVNFQRSEFLCFWSVNRESVKELIYQKKKGGHQASKRVISIVTHQNNNQIPVSEHYISHHMFDKLVFLMILCALTKQKCILVC